MLDITNNTIENHEAFEKLKSVQKTALPPSHIGVKRLLLVFLAVLLIGLFLPWTQNIQAPGKLTTLRPEQRPQTIHATISGRIEKWYVMEGQEVKKGDTIVYLSEVKSDYMDPQLIARMGNQIDAKEDAINAYSNKAGALSSQINALNRELLNKIGQTKNKIEQQKLKVMSDSIAIQQAQNDLAIAKRQFEGNRVLFEKGVKSLSDFEDKRLKMVETETKLVKAVNNLEISKNELNNAQIELTLTQNEFANKIAKANSDRFSTLSEQFDATVSVNKLKTETENYTRRSSFYVITAPQDGYIIQAMTPGIGEIIKEGAPVVSILPQNAELAVEMYVKPIDVPLLQPGNTVRFLFDGWPAFFFSGWPGLSLGTYAGKVVAIDRNISSNNKFRVLVAPDQSDANWPEALRVGGGAKGIALLNDVPVWYELWRVINGFPPDMYASTTEKTIKK
jgi:adhesin transport system membrane fusion protein